MDIIVDFCYSLLRILFGPIIRLLFIKKVEGLENIPPNGPAILAFNHQSYFDFICFIAISPRNIHYLAAEKFFSNKFWRPIMKITGQIEVKRLRKDKRHVHDEVEEHLKKSKVIGIFPEGTRSPSDKEILKVFSGVAKYAVKSKVPVVPVGIIGTYEIMSRHHTKPNIQKEVEIKIGQPIEFTEYNNFKLNRRAYQLLTDKIMNIIAELSGKKYVHTWKK